MLFHLLTWFVTSSCLQVAVEFADSAPAPRTRIAAKAPVKPLDDAASREKLVGELIKIIEDTKSPDTFCVTISVLDKMQAGSPELIPVVIRNAERLGVFNDVIVRGKKTKSAREAVEGVADILESFVEQMTGGDENDRDAPPARIVCPVASPPTIRVGAAPRYQPPQTVKRLKP